MLSGLRNRLRQWLAPDSEFRERLLDLDAFLDSAVFEAGSRLRDRYWRLSAYLDWPRESKLRRTIVEGASECLTVTAAGLVVMLAFAVPVFGEAPAAPFAAQPELSVTFLDRFGHEIGARGGHQDESIPLADYPDFLIQAVLATEDRGFYRHYGIDLPATLRALTTDLMADHIVQGGSSITQQLAKNLYLTQQRTIGRKIKEAFLALWLESRLSKDQILKLYLDRSYLGAGCFGVEAASQLYFGKSVRDVNLAEAAMLAGLFKAPSRYAPSVNLPAARARANLVLDNLVDAGFMTEGQVWGARNNPATAIETDASHGRGYDESSPNYYLDWAFDEVQRIVARLPRPLPSRTLTVRTAIDMRAQRGAESAIENALREYGREYRVSESAAVLMDLTGGVRGLVGGRDYGQSQFNRAVDALRQPGSSFKPYVYATALASGLKPTSLVTDAPICIGDWCPENYSHSYAGTMTLTSALAHSVNTVAVRLPEIIGRGNARRGRAAIIETARRMGVRTPLRDIPALPIGVDEMTVLEQAGAYAAFPNLGMAVTPHAVLQIATADGQVVWRFDRDGPKPRRALSPQVAGQMIRMMSKVVEEGTGRSARLDGVPAAGKTGTTSSYKDAWFVGYTGNFVCAVWFGNDDSRPMLRMTGGSVPALAWREIMTEAHQGVAPNALPGLPAPIPQGPAVAAAESAAGERTALLTGRATTVLRRLAQELDGAARKGETPVAGLGPPARQREGMAKVPGAEPDAD